MAGMISLILRRVCVLVALGALSGAAPGRAQEDRSRGTLEIDGEFVENLTLVDRQNRPTMLASPGEKVDLPLGEYRVQHVAMTDGFNCHAYLAEEEDWFVVSADKPCRVAIGGPLVAEIEVTRQANLLSLDYALLDAGGRKYSPDGHSDPPTFRVSKDGREIGSGTFEYG